MIELPINPIEGQIEEIGTDVYEYIDGVWNKKYVEVVDTTSAQVISAKKTFEVTPQVMSAPTANKDVVNKAYVDSKFTSALTSDDYQGVYGLNWNETSDTYTRTGSDGYTAIQSRMKRCVLNDDRSVNYYLDPLDSTKKADGTPSVLNGSDGNVMVEVPKFYYKYNYNTSSGVVHEHSISLTEDSGYVPHPAFIINGEEKNARYYPAYLGSYTTKDGVERLMSVSGTYPRVSQTRAQFRAKAELNGEGWHQIDFLLYEAITLLMIIEYGTMNIQSALGEGRTMLSGGTWSNGSYIGLNGLSNNLGNKSGNYTYSGDADNAEADLSFMSYRGCEDFFGNVWRMVDGINIQEHVPFVSQNPSTFTDDVFTGDYVSAGVTMGSANGYTRQLGNSSKGMFPVSVSGGSSVVGTTDYYYQAAGNRVALVGGYAGYGLASGPLYLSVAAASGLSAVSVGAGVCC